MTKEREVIKFKEPSEVRMIKTTVERCARCGEDHEVMFKPLTNPQDEWTHWGVCQATGEPIMCSIRKPSDTTPERRLTRAFEDALSAEDRESVSRIDNYVAADYLVKCLRAFEAGVVSRDNWLDEERK